MTSVATTASPGWSSRDLEVRPWPGGRSPTAAVLVPEPPAGATWRLPAVAESVARATYPARTPPAAELPAGGAGAAGEAGEAGEDARAAARKPSPELQALIDANAALWAGEAEVFRTYWDWAGRTPDTDCSWLVGQCFKELFDGFLPRLRELSERFPALEQGMGRADVLESAGAAYGELARYCAFAGVYDALRGGRPPLSLAGMREQGDWDENVDLALARARHCWEYGGIATRAQALTDSGYCTLYSEGMSLAGRGGGDGDELIARACAVAYEDEWGHTLTAIADLDDGGLDPEAVERIADLSVQQMKLRVRMRNAQFGFPLPPDRIRAIDAGDVDPLPFDYASAGLLSP